jgi:hypothetical protein
MRRFDSTVLKDDIRGKVLSTGGAQRKTVVNRRGNQVCLEKPPSSFVLVEKGNPGSILNYVSPSASNERQIVLVMIRWVQELIHQDSSRKINPTSNVDFPSLVGILVF